MYDLIVGQHPILLTPPAPFDFNNPIMDPVELSQLLIKSIKDYNAIGISANQLGINAQVFAIKYDPYYICFNPRIVHESPELAMGTEGCLSYPGLAVKVIRPYSIRVRFQTPSGATTTKNFEGGISRIFQHEMTHMRGEIFWQGANYFHKNKAIKDWKALERKINRHRADLPA